MSVEFSTTKFDSTWKKNEKGEPEQAMPDLPEAKQDCTTLRVALQAYGVTDTGPNNFYVMDEPDENYVI